MNWLARARSFVPARRPLPLRIAYPVVGIVLSIALAIGLLAMRVLADDAESIGGELRANALTYAYVVLSTAGLLGLLGSALGANEDHLWTTSLTDPLTHVANRRHFEHALTEELARAETSGMPLALLLADLDHLKTINDSCGHAAGDAALRALAEVIRGSSRTRDLTARFGGDEFVIVMPRTRATEAWALAERIRTSLETKWAESKFRARIPKLTVSIGIADLDSTGDAMFGVEPATLFDAADRALYIAKSNGRDQAVVASQLDDTLVSVLPNASAHLHESLPEAAALPAPPATTSSHGSARGSEAAQLLPHGQGLDAEEAAEVCIAPGMAPTFCEEVPVRCVSGMFDAPRCDLVDLTGVAAVLESGAISKLTGMPAWPERDRESQEFSVNHAADGEQADAHHDHRERLAPTADGTEGPELRRSTS